MLSSGSSTMTSCGLNDCRNHTMIVATKITVNARVMKSFDLSHTRRPTLLADGMR